jgi:hypothetical protein
MIFSLVFHDIGALILLILFLIVILIPKYKLGKNLKSGDLRVIFAVILFVYVGVKYYVF